MEKTELKEEPDRVGTQEWAQVARGPTSQESSSRL